MTLYSAPDPELSKRALDTLELWAKIAGALTVIALFILKILKPYQDWRRKSLAELIREVLKAELEKLDGLTEREDEVFRALGRVLARQTELFVDIDSFLDIAGDNRERIDEINELLDLEGFTSLERRNGHDRIVRVDEVLEGIRDRRKARRRYTAGPDAPAPKGD